MDSEDQSEGYSLNDIANQRAPGEEARDGRSGKITYEIQYHQKDNTKVVQGKLTELEEISKSKHKDLRKLVDAGYTRYAIFRLKDRTTTTIVEDKHGDQFKAFSFSRNDVKVSHPVTITDIEE